ncbi:hypothetical protein [Rheinheimera salexigens]|uniref:Uncharacterized protein n=1 Tax=Rheinheimera salexigens TaxID=1628148 RepID=A0A1E7Q7G1_9GAMM|nr:hypothetical protein [Rheinheimera salexigens]OEY70086.1 hypothetical protein BI198_11295 [Rheinheimera salexigens]
MKSTNTIRHSLLTHAVKQAKNRYEQDKLESIENNINAFLTAIDAPEDLAGFYYVSASLADLTMSDDDNLQQHLQLPDYLRETLQLDICADSDKSDVNLYRKRHRSLNWAKANPLYLILFYASVLKNSPVDKKFFQAFVRHYITNKTILQAEDIQPLTSTRCEEVCLAFRMLQHADSNMFYVQLFSDELGSWGATEIAAKLDKLLNDSESILNKKDRPYVSSLKRFFSNDWQPPRPRRAVEPQSNKRKSSKPRFSGIALNPSERSDYSKLEALPVLDEDGVDSQDIEILRTHFINSVEDEPERLIEDRNSIGAIFDSDLQFEKSINITNSLRRSNNLNLTSNLILSKASIRVVRKICERILIANRESESEFMLFCMFTTGLSLERLSKLKVIKNLKSDDEGIYLDKNNFCFWRFKHRASANRAVINPEDFYPSSPWVLTPCPNVISVYIGGMEPNNGQMIFNSDSNKLQTKLDKVLQRESETFMSSNISTSMIENFLVRFIDADGKVDPIVIDFSYQVACYATRVSRSYVNLSDGERIQMLKDLWNSISDYAAEYSLPTLFAPELPAKKLNNRVGSPYVPKADYCKQLVAQLKQQLKASKPKFYKPLNEIINYHNNFIRYTAWMINFATGYRAVHNPLPTLALYIPSLKLLTLSDKDDGSFSHTRIVVVAEVLAEQLKNLVVHLRVLRDLLSLFDPDLTMQISNVINNEKILAEKNESQIIDWFVDNRNSRQQHGPLFYIDKAMNLKPVSPSWLVNSAEEGITGPANMGRHWLKTTLLTSGLPPEPINLQMGHWQEGQSPLYLSSTYVFADSSNQMASVISGLLISQGWQACKSDLL